MYNLSYLICYKIIYNLLSYLNGILHFLVANNAHENNHLVLKYEFIEYEYDFWGEIRQLQIHKLEALML